MWLTDNTFCSKLDEDVRDTSDQAGDKMTQAQNFNLYITNGKTAEAIAEALAGAALVESVAHVTEDALQVVNFSMMAPIVGERIMEAMEAYVASVLGGRFVCQYIIRIAA